MITLKNSYGAYTRATDAKIELLREVIARVKNGEKVDVEKLLGTGDEAKEREWDEGNLTYVWCFNLMASVSLFRSSSTTGNRSRRFSVASEEN